MTRRRTTSTGAAAAQPALDRTLTWRLHRLHKLTDLQSNRAYAEHTGMSISDGRCLAAIGSFAPLSVNDLAAHAHLTKGQASRAAQALVDAGLVSKTTSDADSRGVVLNLTAPGKAAWQRVMQLIAQRNAEIFGCLSGAEQQQLHAAYVGRRPGAISSRNGAFASFADSSGSATGQSIASRASFQRTPASASRS